MSNASIFTACVSGNIREVEALIANNASGLMVVDKDGWVPLHHAVWNGREAVVNAILASCAQCVSVPEKYGRTPLHLACTPYHSDYKHCMDAVVEKLISAGADVFSVDSKGRTPLHVAAQTSSSRIVQALLMANANVDAKDNQGAAPLYEAVTFARANSSIIEALIEVGAGMTTHVVPSLLHVAVRNWNECVIKILLDSGVDVEAVDKNGLTALDLVNLRWKGDSKVRIVTLLKSEMSLR